MAGEGPEDAANRELLEETGYRARAVEHLGRILTSPGFTDEVIDLFLVDARPSEGGETDGGRNQEAGIEVVVLPLVEAVAAVFAGEVEDAKTALALLLAARRRGLEVVGR